MTGEFEAMANVATGALAARAIEAESAAGADGHTHESHCLNCGTALVGPHCHRCGQHAHVHRTLGGFGHDILHGAFHFEGKIWGTLPLLAFRPGELTRRYIHGERMKFVSPMALFLFSVFLFYAVYHLVGGPIRGGGGHETTVEAPKSGGVSGARAEIARERAVAERKVRSLEQARTAALAAGRPTARIDERLADARRDLTELDVATGAASAVRESSRPGSDIEVDTGVPTIDRAVRHVAGNPDLVAYKMQSNAYKFSWALIPISLPFIWLMFFWKRGYTMYDHAIFATFSLAAMMLLIVALSLLAVVLWTPIIVLALVILPPWHMYRQLKGAYLLSRAGALWRTAFLLGSASAAGVLFFMVLITMQMAA